MADVEAIDVALQGKTLDDEKRSSVVETCDKIADASAESLTQLAQDAAEYPEVRDILRESNGIDGLLKLVEATSASIGQRGAALKLLFQCSIENEQNPGVIADAGGIAVLAAVLADDSDYTSEHKVDAVGTLFNVTSFVNDGSEPVAGEAVIDNIVSLLRSATVDEEGKAWAAGTLQNLAGGHPEHRVAIGGTPNAVATLLDQARSPATSTDTRRIVVAALYNLTIDNATNQEIILSNKGVETLTWLLRCGAKTLGADGSAEGAAAAAGSGGDKGGDDDLVDVAITTLAYAAGALQNLAFDRTERQKEIFAAGGLKALLQLIAVPMPALTGPEGQPADIAEEEAFLGFMELRTNAAGALFNLTGGHSDDIDRFIQSSGHIGDIVALLRSNEPETITNAAGALFNITCELEDVKNAVGNADGIHALLETGTYDTEATAWACGALRNLSALPAWSERLVAAGGIPLIVDALMQTTDARVAAWAAAILLNVATWSTEGCVEIMEENAADELVKLATEDEEGMEEIVEAASAALRVLAKREKAWRRQIIDLGGGEVVDATLFEVCCGC